jgi:hypothetical protein
MPWNQGPAPVTYPQGYQPVPQQPVDPGDGMQNPSFGPPWQPSTPTFTPNPNPNPAGVDMPYVF